MQYLALRLYGPAAAWGNDQAGDERRPTDRRPGRSALLGLLAAGLGITRDDEQAQADLNASVLFAVASHGPRRVARDFRTVQTVEPGQGRRQVRFETRRDALQHDKTHTVMSWRDYVTDGLWRVFIAHGGGAVSLETLAVGLRKPRFHLYLGRREFPPALPLDPILIEADNLTAAIQQYPAVPPQLASISDWISKRIATETDRSHLTWDANFPTAPDAAESRQVRTQPLSRSLWRFDLTTEYAKWIEGESSD